MVNLAFKLKRENKEKFVDFIEEKFKVLFNLKKKIPFQTKAEYIKKGFYDYPSGDNILLTYDFDLDKTSRHKEQIIELIKEIIRSNLAVDSYAVLEKKENGYINYSEIIVYPQFEDEVFDKDIKFEELKPDYKEKIGDKYILRFDFRLKEGKVSSNPNNYESLHTIVTLKYLGTGKTRQSGLVIHSKNDDKYHCDRLIVGKLHHKLASGAMVNDEHSILKALQKVNEMLKKKGKEIVDLETAYKRILSELKKNENK
jgi:hypothetical protein